MYREPGLYVRGLSGERNNLGTGRVGDEHGAILLEISSLMRFEGNHSAKRQIRATPQLWKTAGRLFPRIFLTSISHDGNYHVLIVMVLGKGEVLPDTGNIFKAL
jgi:hypothetical protein